MHDQGYHIKIKRGQRRTGTLMWVMVMVVVMAVTHGNNLPVFVFPKGRTRRSCGPEGPGKALDISSYSEHCNSPTFL